MAQQPPIRVERRLSAILAADVAGYSRLMHNDEEATHARLTMLLAGAVEPSIAQHGGRVVKNTGDGLLAEFRSAVEALRAATQFQERVHDLTIGDPDEKRLAFRVGINIGDVIVEPHDIFGDGVNVAARLEGIAKPGGICISASTYEQVVGKVAIKFTDLGEQSLKNIARPVRAYAVVPRGSGGATRTGGETPGPHSVPRLSIVVLPFANLGGNSEQDYFVDGITESLTTDLSRINGSFVIARNTAFTFKGKAMDVQKLGRELNVRYVLEGSVQRGGNRLRVNVQLIDVETGNHLWADRFDKPITNLFDMQDEIVSSLANALNAQLIEAEARRAERLLRPDALDLVFQGSSCWNKGMTAEHMAHARLFFERALMLDPGNIEALVGIAAVDSASAAYYMVHDRDARFAAAEATLLKVLSMSPQHARAHMFLGSVQIATQRAAQGIREGERALALDRNLADAHGLIGWAKVLIGRGEEAEAHIQDAFRLSPRDTGAFRWMHWAGFTKLVLGADAEAVAWLRRCLDANRNYPFAHFHLAAALALLGSLEEARAAVRAGLALDPTFTIRRMRGRMSDDPTFRAGIKRALEGMRMAGVPEE
jgi:TolB-like protein/class 3 adenylate cyclase/Flp pilus assembly protein TadD